MSNSTSQLKTVIVGVPMTEQARDEIDAIAKERRWSRAEATRYLIELGLAHEAKTASAA